MTIPACGSWLLMAALTGIAALGQQPIDSQLPGSIAGHVYRGDSNAPARFARVTIEPVEDFDEAPPEDKTTPGVRRLPSTILVETRLDGSYSIEKVSPGKYLILAELPGYLSPLGSFTSDEVSLAADQAEKRIRLALRQVTVLSGQTTRMDFRLEKGAAISGIVLYDDGTPVAGVPVGLLRREKDGSWKEVSEVMRQRFGSQQTTDDRGHYRVAALPQGEYLVSVDLQWLSASATGQVLWTSPLLKGARESAHIYSGDTARRRDAKPVVVDKGEERTGVDVVVPISRLYSLSGTVVAERDGHPINSGTVILLDALDRTTVNQVWLNAGSGRFAMEFVPQGDYVLQVTSTADGVMETGQIDGGHGTYTRLKQTHHYADTEQPMKISGDVQGVTVKVKDASDEGDWNKGARP
jgi:hypothetical protein